MAQKNVTAPRLPNATPEYNAGAMNQLLSALRLYFNQLDNAGPMAGASQFNGTAIVAGLSFAPNAGATTPSLPTQADLANLRVGDIYYDTTFANALKVNAVGGTFDLSSPPPIGGTTPAAGTFTTLIGGGGSANYGQLTGGATTKAVEFKTLGTDTNVAFAIRTQGTGAIDLAAGSRGVNISNGGTVTAITGTATGTYTTVPTFTISAPTTAGGVQATGTVSMQILSGSTIAAAGSGYSIGDTITLTGGTSTQTAVLTVATLSGSGVATFTVTTAGIYTVLPSNPISTTSSGAGTGFQLTGSWGVRTAGYTITNAGSGYVEQPTVTFSSGTAAAYASVGAGSIIRSLGSTGTQSLDFYTPAGISTGVPNFRMRDTTGDSYWQSANQSQTAILTSVGNANANAYIIANGTGFVSLRTGGGNQIEQFRVTNTTSAVNYVQVTGAATGGTPSISFQGSDAAITGAVQTKGGASFSFYSQANLTGRQVRIDGSANAVNYLDFYGSIASSSPSVRVGGTDTDIDLTLTPKGTGRVRFGTYTGTILAPTGFVEIKDSGGTTRRLLVG